MNGKQLIVQAAFELFSEKGFAAVSIREIGDRAGLTNPALYQHFKSKEALGFEVYRRRYAELLDAIDQQTNDKGNALERLEGYVDAAVSLHREKPSPLLFLEDEQRQFGSQMKDLFGSRTILPRLTAWVKDGQRQGIIRDDIPQPMLVAMTIGQVTKWAALSSLGLAPVRGAAGWLKAQMRSALMVQNQK